MTARTLTARFPGFCSKTNRIIKPGDAITYNRRTRKSVLVASAEYAVVADDSKYISNYTRLSSGAEIYRNKRGLCIDAPCCGCCSG